ncbi:MAG: hypothetical protein IJQ63_09180 [Synergistaceae bacterium]|nr:hypothetical protein [Synergistaceae bacterium]
MSEYIGLRPAIRILQAAALSARRFLSWKYKAGSIKAGSIKAQAADALKYFLI